MSARAIRRATIDDAAVLALAERVVAKTAGLLASRPEEIHEDELGRKIVAANERGVGAFLVAEEGGDVIGHGVLQPYKLAVTAHVVELTLVVHEGHRGRGVGRMLMEALVAWARASAHVETIELRVRASNARAIGLYEKLGFVEEGRFKNRIKLGPETYLDDLAMGMWVGADLPGRDRSEVPAARGQTDKRRTVGKCRCKRPRSSASLVYTTPPPRREADAITAASASDAPFTDARASPVARHRAFGMSSTRTIARISSRMSVRPRHHSA